MSLAVARPTAAKLLFVGQLSVSRRVVKRAKNSVRGDTMLTDGGAEGSAETWLMIELAVGECSVDVGRVTSAVSRRTEGRR